MPRRCNDCGKTTNGGTRCDKCARAFESERQGRQWYRFVYRHPDARRARAAVLRRAGGRCEATLNNGERCPEIVHEVHHARELSDATSKADALARGTDTSHMFGVCRAHNPRGQRQGRAISQPEPDQETEATPYEPNVF